MHIVNICFSPTGGTQRTADMLVQAMAARSTAIDLSDCKRTMLRPSLCLLMAGECQSRPLTAFLPSTKTMPGPS